ncbi:MAG: DUF2726 domain-containing protein [Chloroflexi bacterium]|nr:DUF2726 domain-containing protein [Chloroflexota bacterium]
MSEEPNLFPYRLRQQFLSPAESAFFHVLTEMMQNRLFVCPKVALQDLFFVLRPNENVTYANKLQRKNIDFLLLQHDSLKPILAIELDYPKQAVHGPAENFLDGLFAAAGLPLVHVVVQQTYDIRELSRRFRAAISKSGDSTMPLHTDYSPICPRCGITMVLRFDKNGPVNGQKYYGCLNFPGCEETVAVTA